MPVLISVGRNEEDGATRLTVQKVQFNSVLAFLSLSEELLSHKKSTGRHAEVTLALRYTLGQQVEAIISEVQSMLVAREVFFFMVVNVMLQKVLAEECYFFFDECTFLH